MKEKIKTEVLESEHVDDSSGDPDSRSVNFKISQIIKEVNSPDLLRYLPDDMLTDIQKKEKYTAIAETLRYTKANNDKAYAKALLHGDIATAQKIVNAAARASGYSNSELVSMDVLYAINAKKESTAVLNAPRVSTPSYRTTISISELLDYVNRYFPDILHESVLRHYGEIYCICC